MTATPLLDWGTAVAKRDAGMTAAVDHADRVTADWSRAAGEYLAQYASRADGSFLAEDVREYAAGQGLEDPPDGRAWGAVLSRAAKAGVIVSAGFAAARSSNGSPKVLWKRT